MRRLRGQCDTSLSGWWKQAPEHKDCSRHDGHRVNKRRQRASDRCQQQRRPGEDGDEWWWRSSDGVRNMFAGVFIRGSACSQKNDKQTQNAFSCNFLSQFHLSHFYQCRIIKIKNQNKRRLPKDWNEQEDDRPKTFKRLIYYAERYIQRYPFKTS